MYGEPMKIQLGNIYINRTRKYLFPIVKHYGKEFTGHINNLNKLGIGIGDIITNKCGVHHEKHLFILIDTIPNMSMFAKTLEWLKTHPAYEDDYVFDTVHKGRLHMIVIKIPDLFIKSMENFKKSDFSKMYTPEQIKEFFSYTGTNPEQAEAYSKIQKVLIHEGNYAIEFAKQIEKEFSIEFKPSELSKDQEFDFPILLQEEFFNVSTQNEDGEEE